MTSSIINASDIDTVNISNNYINANYRGNSTIQGNSEGNSEQNSYASVVNAINNEHGNEPLDNMSTT